MKQYVIIFIMFVLALGELFADEIYLKDGTSINGKIINISEDSIEYNPEGDLPFDLIEKSSVERVKYDDGRELNIRTNDKSRISRFMDDVKSKLSTTGLQRNKLMIWGGTHRHLYGYTDSRYIDNGDQSDYIKTDSGQFGLEFYNSDFSYLAQSLKSARIGFNICGYRHDEIRQRTLYAVPLHNILEETIPNDNTGFDRNVKWWYYIGFFFGVDKRWYGLDLGLTIKTTIITEKRRKRLAPDSDPQNPGYIETDGRGEMFDDSGLVLNGLLRLGIEDKPHFTLSAFRANYDPLFGALQGKISFPMNRYFSINIGGYLWQTQAPFVEPVFTIKGVSMGYKAGVIINYHDEELEKANIKDSLFHSISLAYEW